MSAVGGSADRVGAVGRSIDPACIGRIGADRNSVDGGKPRRSVDRRVLCIVLAALLPVLPAVAAPAAFPAGLLDAAAGQVGVTLHYDAAYARIAYPGGDVPLQRGVCTDVVIRAYRAIGVDLQQRVHEDMRANWSAYPKLWGLRGPDRNIDHRRVPNLATFFARHGRSLKLSQSDAAIYAPGDIVTWMLPGNLPHIGLVIAQRRNGRPLIVHNIGAGTQIEDALFEYPITGHYRYEP
jgi:uncharacterized protein YijF (DUF1287 family)